jgi:mRNA interferase RelE/StbE
LSYRLEVEDRAARELIRLPKKAVARISEAIRTLGDEPRPPGVKKLTARDGYRIRVGNYRVLYVVEDDLQRVRIFRIGDRKNVYQ